MKATLTLAAATCLAGAVSAQEQVLTIYAGDYVASEWGPGPKIEELFEARCDCDLQFSTGDLLPRLLLEGENTEADVVFGLTTDVTKRARESGLFAPHGQDTSELTLPVEWTDDVFLPYNYGHTAFVYDTDRLPEPPQSFDGAAQRAGRSVDRDPGPAHLDLGTRARALGRGHLRRRSRGRLGGSVATTS